MSMWSRADDDVKLAVTAWRQAADARRERRIRDAEPVARAELIANIRCGFATAEMIARDIHDSRTSRRTDPIRWSIDAMKEASKRSMLVAQIEHIGHLMRDLGADTGRTAMS
ncbi:hypothetical protein [Bosea sp. (in: a-proteobacteria)]|uniref:hypothetical protein n=1 Tax=Bosea sp. (in: a-proteobacteria) TaxID=1871050 RepID=UPI001AD2DBC5|nr:hypothetical protein [Bosea sp. (in: a-proteobacteria)]MBN9437162.1 hypothetical protein [Bosea sp. (in: a-proteobacteria)]